MQPIAFCNRCRGMQVGWNRRYVLHCLMCQELLFRATKLLVLTGLVSAFLFAFPIATGVNSPDSLVKPVENEVAAASSEEQLVRATANLERMLTRYGVSSEWVPRVARAIMASSIKYNLDPRLIASIVIVESGANPFAVSSKDSVGVMQIHLKTWGQLADEQNINLFKVEDNVDFGARILHDYIAANGVWEGVARYCGRVNTPESYQAAADYVEKIQKIYEGIPQKASLD